MGLDPQVFNSEVRRRALEWRSNQEEEFRAKGSATLKERVHAETHAYLTRMGILDTKNPVLKNLQVKKRKPTLRHLSTDLIQTHLDLAGKIVEVFVN